MATICEVCEEPCLELHLCGCEQCGKLYGPCCNSEQEDLCCECAIGHERDDDEGQLDLDVSSGWAPPP